MARQPEGLLRFDDVWSAGGALRLAGVDEAGRGSWAGPVVAAAVILPPGWSPVGLDDSKRLTPSLRERLFAEIITGALDWGACSVSAATIDRINILQATLLAMANAVGRLWPTPELVIVDGTQLPRLPCPGVCVAGADGRSAAVAAASVIAKVLRDRVMRVWDRRLPGYGFASNKGYGCAAHRQALRDLGPCPLHRHSYRPVAGWSQGRLWNDSR